MLEELQDMIRRYADDGNIVVAGDMALLTDLGLNSYELVQLICEIEERFSIEIPDRVIGSLRTVQNVIDYIAAQ